MGLFNKRTMSLACIVVLVSSLTWGSRSNIKAASLSDAEDTTTAETRMAAPEIPEQASGSSYSAFTNDGQVYLSRRHEDYASQGYGYCFIASDVMMTTSEVRSHLYDGSLASYILSQSGVTVREWGGWNRLDAYIADASAVLDQEYYSGAADCSGGYSVRICAQAENLPERGIYIRVNVITDEPPIETETTAEPTTEATTTEVMTETTTTEPETETTTEEQTTETTTESITETTTELVTEPSTETTTEKETTTTQAETTTSEKVTETTTKKTETTTEKTETTKETTSEQNTETEKTTEETTKKEELTTTESTTKETTTEEMVTEKESETSTTTEIQSETQTTFSEPATTTTKPTEPIEPTGQTETTKVDVEEPTTEELFIGEIESESNYFKADVKDDNTTLPDIILPEEKKPESTAATDPSKDVIKHETTEPEATSQSTQGQESKRAELAFAPGSEDETTSNQPKEVEPTERVDLATETELETTGEVRALLASDPPAKSSRQKMSFEKKEAAPQRSNVVAYGNTNRDTFAGNVEETGVEQAAIADVVAVSTIGISPKVDNVAVSLFACGSAMAGGFTFTLFQDFRVLLWYAKKKRERMR